jgi:hypothetical protein
MFPKYIRRNQIFTFNLSFTGLSDSGLSDYGLSKLHSFDSQ